VIAKNLYSNVDHVGNRYFVMDSIIDHKKYDQAMSKEEAFIEMQGKRI
jgi:hypothetical protein